MMGNRGSQQRLTARELERAVKLGHSFIEPEGRARQIIFEMKVHILMKSRVVRQALTGIERNDDVINIFSRLEVASDICGSTLVERFEWRKGGFVTKDKYGCGHGGVENRSGYEPAKRRMKKLEPHCHLLQSLRIGIADNNQIVCANATPGAFALRSGWSCGKPDEEN